MNRFFKLTAGAAIAALAIVVASAEPTVGPAVQAHGGNGKGTNILRASDDLTLTEITRVELGYAKLVSELTNARNAITAASFASRANSPEIIAKVQAVANAELALAMARVEAFQALKAKLNYTTPEKIQKLATAMSGGGGRGGRAAAPAAAPAGAPAAPARGN